MTKCLDADEVFTKAIKPYESLHAVFVPQSFLWLSLLRGLNSQSLSFMGQLVLNGRRSRSNRNRVRMSETIVMAYLQAAALEI